MNKLKTKKIMLTLLTSVVSYIILANVIDRIIRLPAILEYCWGKYSLSAWKLDDLACFHEPTELGLLVMLTVFLTLFIIWYFIFSSLKV